MQPVAGGGTAVQATLKYTGKYEGAYAGFSCPQIPLDKELLDLVVAGHAGQIVETFLSRHGTELMSRSVNLSPVLEAWLSGCDNEQFDTVWHPAFGDAHAALLSQMPEDPVRCAAALALRLHDCGIGGSWEATLSAPARFRFDRWVFPEVTALKVDAAPAKVVVRTRTGAGWNTSVFYPDSGYRWVNRQTGYLQVLPVCQGQGFRFTLATPQTLSASGSARLLEADAYRFEPNEVSMRDEWRATCDDAMALIADVSRAYSTWVGRVLRDLIPLQARPRTFNSGSERFSPGAICVSDQPYRWALAEMLVHECTHQYLHIVSRLGPLDDGSDEKLYFSPFRNKDRPIFFIAVAYHAFANVLLFYRTARRRGMIPDRGIMSEVFGSREETLARQLGAIEEPLRNATSLTPLGSALWEPLYEQLHDGPDGR